MVIKVVPDRSPCNATVKAPPTHAKQLDRHQTYLSTELCLTGSSLAGPNAQEMREPDQDSQSRFILGINADWMPVVVCISGRVFCLCLA